MILFFSFSSYWLLPVLVHMCHLGCFLPLIFPLLLLSWISCFLHSLASFLFTLSFWRSSAFSSFSKNGCLEGKLQAFMSEISLSFHHLPWLPGYRILDWKQFFLKILRASPMVFSFSDCWEVNKHSGDKWSFVSYLCFSLFWILVKSFSQYSEISWWFALV